ncbi:MAG: hypothetical protein ACWGO1_03210 [Anaerolineales bacterium]
MSVSTAFLLLLWRAIMDIPTTGIASHRDGEHLTPGFSLPAFI